MIVFGECNSVLQGSKYEQTGRLELQVMPAPELSEERFMPAMWGLKIWR